MIDTIMIKEYNKKNNFINMTNILLLCQEWGFDYRKYEEKVFAIGNVCAIRRTKQGKFFHRNYERAMLLLAVASKYKSTSVLEFGTGRGFAAVCLSMLQNITNITTIDKLDQTKTIQLVANLGIDKVKLDKINFISKNTLRLSSKDKEEIGKDFDLVFIDGEHTRVAVKNDLEVALDCTTEDAVIVFDDYRNKHKGVKKYIKSLEYDKILVYSDGWIYNNVMIAKHGDADKVKDNREYGSGQVILYKNCRE